jgi:diguanylate cyclase (GGDEF)-like protein
MNSGDLEIKRFSNVVETLDIGVIIRNADDKVIYVNSIFLKMYKLSITNKEFKNLELDKVIQLIKRFSKDEELIEKNIKKCFEKREVNKGFLLELKDGKTVKQTYVPIYSDDGNFIGESLMYEDVSEKIYLQTKVLEFATFDALTKVYNRKKIKEETKKYIDLAKRYDNKLTLAIFDIDNYKSINDLYGQEVGDNILIKIADIVNKRKRTVDIFGRWGGGEFAIILPETDLDGANTFAEYLKSKISEIILDEKEGRITASFGLTNYVENETLDQFFNRAYTALDKSKKEGKNKVSFIELAELIV